ncbi:hypothetical protein GCM10027425_17240 [Alteromonas gracilis]
MPRITGVERARVDKAVEDGDWEFVSGWLSALDDERRAEAARWYAKGVRTLARRQVTWDQEHRTPALTILVALAVSLAATPADAVKHSGLGRMWHPGDDGWQQHTSELLERRGEEFALDFARTLSTLVLRGGRVDEADVIARAALPVLTAAGEPMPTGSLPIGWAQEISRVSVGPEEFPHLTDSWERMRAAEAAFDLTARLRRTPRLQDVLVAALRTPAFATWHQMPGSATDLPQAIRTLVTEGRLERGPLLEETLAALTRADRTVSQRMQARILTGLDLAGPDAHERMPLIAHLMPSVHGSATEVLLPAALGAPPTEDELLDLGSVILSRTEKAQRRLLLDHLLAGDRAGEAVQTLLAMAAEDSDRSLADRAREALGEAGSAPGEEGAAYAWSEPAADGPTPPLELYSADAAGLDRALSDRSWDARPHAAARFAALLADYAHRDPEGLVDQMRERRAEFFWATEVEVAGIAWVDPAWEEEEEEDPWPNEPGTVTVRTEFEDVELFERHLLLETLAGPPAGGRLLSTPSLADGRLLWTDLTTRLDAAEAVGPHDLVQALLRLDPGDTPAGAVVDGTPVPVRLPAPLDARAVVAGWLAGGGLPDRIVVSDEPDHSRLPAQELPLPESLRALDGLDTLWRLFEADAWRVHRPPAGEGWYHAPVTAPWDLGRYVGMVPAWTEAAAAMLFHSTNIERVDLPASLAHLTSGAGEWGFAMHRLLARLQDHPRADCRPLVVDALVTGVRRKRLDPDELATRTVEAFEIGALSVSRATATWELACRAGITGAVWPAATALLGAALAAPRLPPKTAGLMRLLADAVPTARAHDAVDRIPSQVQTLADSRAKSAAAVEAMHLVATLAAR